MYFIAHVLPAELNEKIQFYKQVMLERYGCKVGLKSPAHITLIAPFWLEPGKEKGLINNLDLISRDHCPFIINTLNFAAFKPRTIFIDVIDNKDLNTLKSSIERQFVNNKDYNIKSEDRPFKPHITIATRDLTKKSFSEAWAHFENKQFEKKWVANSISLLHHNKKNWDVIHTSQFSIASNQLIQNL
jgi:2'-5' RNA ligase